MTLAAPNVRIFSSQPRKMALYFPDFNGIERTVRVMCYVNLVNGNQHYQVEILDPRIGDPPAPEDYYVDGPIRLLSAWRTCRFMSYLPMLNSLYFAETIFLGYGIRRDKEAAQRILERYIGLEEYLMCLRELPPRFIEFVEQFIKTPARLDVDEIMIEYLRERIPGNFDVAYTASYYEYDRKTYQQKQKSARNA